MLSYTKVTLPLFRKYGFVTATERYTYLVSPEIDFCMRGYHAKLKVHKAGEKNESTQSSLTLISGKLVSFLLLFCFLVLHLK